MFDKLKQIKQLRDLQSAAQKEKFESKKDGVRVVINGTLSVEEIRLNSELESGRQEKVLQDCLNEALRKAQMAMAQKFQGMM
ncbi:MAG: YbaB/EbfC family nucleoid-associated protein [Candidatus Wildermuthbacteria bacterium]|nr:YbaB/EbfC family nucleoid-associated protein [Candidatus Wildermuthbacteria bacterium]